MYMLPKQLQAAGCSVDVGVRVTVGIPVAVAVWVAVVACAGVAVVVGVGATKGPKMTGKKTRGFPEFSVTTVYAMPLLRIAIVQSRSVR